MDYKDMLFMAVLVWFFIAILFLVIENFLFYIFLQKKGITSSFFFSGTSGYLDMKARRSSLKGDKYLQRLKARKIIQVNALLSLIVFILALALKGLL